MSFLKKIATSYLYDICIAVEEKFFGESGKGTEKLAQALSYAASKLPWYIRLFLNSSTIEALISDVIVPQINKLTQKLKP